MLQKRNIFTLVAASATLTFLAASIEGFVSPSMLPYSIKFSIAVSTLLLIIGYFLVWPIFLKILERRQGHHDQY